MNLGGKMVQGTIGSTLIQKIVQINDDVKWGADFSYLFIPNG